MLPGAPWATSPAPVLEGTGQYWACASKAPRGLGDGHSSRPEDWPPGQQLAKTLRTSIPHAIP